jgi:hypothetical protein
MISNILELVGAALVIGGIALLSPALGVIGLGVTVAAIGYTLGDRK